MGGGIGRLPVCGQNPLPQGYGNEVGRKLGNALVAGRLLPALGRGTEGDDRQVDGDARGRQQDGVVALGDQVYEPGLLQPG